MWHAFFLAVGIYLVLFGAQCLGVERFILNVNEPPPQTQGEQAEPAPGLRKQYCPPPWVPWSLMSTGAIVCLYSYTIPHRLKNK